ncbi:MAG: tetratricopeptide repeat protein [Rhodospirillales bacterium]|nr:MAG: tetratricopeptide repeat protein [Rhodospirillales bacterium]
MTGSDVSPHPVQPPPFAAFEAAFALHQAGRLHEALPAYESALKEQPGHIPSLVNIAVVLRRLGQLEPSLRYLYLALEADPKQPGVWQNLGETLRRLKRFDEALASFKRAARDSQILLAAIGGMAAALKDAGQLDEALFSLEDLLQRDPGNALAWGVMGDVLFDLGRDEAAQVALLRAIRLKPSSATHHIRLAYQLSQRGRYKDSEGIYRALLAQGAMGVAPVHVGLAQVLISQGRLSEAEVPLAKARELDPNLVDAYLAGARMNFLAGRLREAWEDYDWRKRHLDFTPPHLPVPMWRGESLEGRTLLLLGEQGAGDTLQFLRYVPLLAARGANIVLATTQALEPLVRGMDGLSDVVSDSARLPKADFYAHLLDLPALMGTTLETIPARVPYLKAPEQKPGLRLEAPRGTRLKVGIAFAGNPRHRGDRQRTVDFSRFSNLFGIEGVAFYSLQVGQELPGEAKPFLATGLLTDLAPLIKDYADTAILLDQLDLVISVDTALVHLAGALGRPAWVLLPFAPDWRWLLKRQDSPWYPSLTLFRQPAPNAWEAVMLNVAKALYEKSAALEVLTLPSAIKKSDGQPRFTMTLPKSLMNDPGAAFIVKRESEFGGYEYATRAFLDAHLRPGDLVLDIGAHWGLIALHAASRWPGEVMVLAVEPDRANAQRMSEWVALNGMAHTVEVIVAGCASQPGQGRLLPGGNSSMGFSVVPDAKGGLPLVSIDSLLAERPGLKGRRCFVKVDVEGLEPEVVAGMSGLIKSDQLAAIVLERGRDYDTGPAKARFLALLNSLAERGFRLMRFASEQLAGPLMPFVMTEDLCNFVALAPGFAPLAVYPRSKSTGIATPTQAERARVTGETKARRSMALKAAKASDAGFWSDPFNLKDLAEERAKAAAPLLPAKGKVLDLGAGLMRLKPALAPGVDYVAADLVPWTAETVPVDLNQGQFPQGRFDAIALLEVLEFLHEPGKVLAKCREASDSLVLTYRLKTKDKIPARRAQGWFNDFDEKGLRRLLDETGWRIDLFVAAEAAATQLILARPKPD